MAEATSMASPVAGARILHERIGEKALSGKNDAGSVSTEADVSARMSLLLAWTSPLPADEDSGEAGQGGV
jgi:hypothetical protein